jgi:SAM-dependent methyltransferase
LRTKFGECPGCGSTLFIELGKDETKVRCLRCMATPIALSQIAAIRHFYPDLSRLRIFEASSRGAVLKFFRQSNANLTTSEFFDDVKFGDYYNGIQCQDLEALTFTDGTFDLCTNTEVMEHVSDDIAAFRELHRVLKPAGKLIFTVPFASEDATKIRATGRGQFIKHILPPLYHGDRLRGMGSVLVYRDYGEDIVDRLLSAGFATAHLFESKVAWFGYSRKVVVAEKACQ